MKLNVKAFGIACGLLWGLGLFVFTWWVIAFAGASAEETRTQIGKLVGLLYVGYSVSPLGSVNGLVWGLVDGFISGAIFAWLYNLLSACALCTKQEQSTQESTQESTQQ